MGKSLKDLPGDIFNFFQGLTKPAVFTDMPITTQDVLGPPERAKEYIQQRVAPPALAAESTPLFQDPNFRFAYETMPQDQEWRQMGPRPNFNPKQPPKHIGDIIRRIFPNEATTAATVAVSEDGNFNPRGENLWNGPGMGIDRGIFAINSNTFNGLMERQGDLLKSHGINSFEDMYDPEKNAITAKIIREGARAYRPETNPNGWGGWFGWQDTGYDLNKGWFSKNDRIEHAQKKKGKKK